LKRRSAASTPKPLEGWTLLCEESLGKRVPAALRENGLTVVVQGELPSIPRGLNDEDLARLAGPQGWILISKDLETRYRPNERIAISRARLRVFQLTRGPWTSEQMIKALLAARARMHRLVKKQSPPFIARINKGGEITTVFTEAELSGGA
jgi:PIN domain-containing protein